MIAIYAARLCAGACAKALTLEHWDLVEIEVA